MRLSRLMILNGRNYPRRAFEYSYPFCDTRKSYLVRILFIIEGILIVGLESIESFQAMPTRNDVKRRRTHKKSKTGCSECKRRHVRVCRGRLVSYRCLMATQSPLLTCRPYSATRNVHIAVIVKLLDWPAHSKPRIILATVTASLSH